MPAPKREDENRPEKTPYNALADYSETDFAFRKRLGGMLPKHLAERVQKIMEERAKELEEDKDAEAV